MPGSAYNVPQQLTFDQVANVIVANTSATVSALSNTVNDLKTNGWNEYYKSQADVLYQPKSTNLTGIGSLANASGVLLNDGSGNFSWAAQGAIKALTSGSVSNVATLDIILSSYSSYRGFRLVIINPYPSTGSAQLALQVSTNGGTSFDSGSSDYAYGIAAGYSGGSNSGGSNGTNMAIVIPGMGGSVPSQSGLAVIDFFGLSDASNWSTWSFTFQRRDSSGNIVGGAGSGVRKNAQSTNALRLICNSGNIASLSYILYGYL